jgi:threonylcarbamoyladenosine tRNA methylthiotransferase MtaB
MVGFPGETDDEFECTRRLIDELPLTYLHVFTYSARPGTPAAGMRNYVPIHIARERNKILRDMAAEKKLAFMRSLVGETVEAITLASGQFQSIDDGSPMTEALTDNYQKVFIEGRLASNCWIRARIQSIVDGAFIAVPA